MSEDPILAKLDDVLDYIWKNTNAGDEQIKTTQRMLLQLLSETASEYCNAYTGDTFEGLIAERENIRARFGLAPEEGTT